MASDTTNQYAWNAADYAGHSEVQQQWAQELIQKLGLRGDEHLLDIGCGDGKVTAALADHLPNGRVLGIDSSSEMIDLAEETHAKTRKNLSFSRQDASLLSFTEEFDIVFSNAALHWIRDHRPVVASIFQALKPGGKVLAQMGGKGNAATVIKAMEHVMEQKKWKEYFTNFPFPYGFYSPEEYRPWLTEAGFEIRSIALIPKTMIHQTGKRFSGWLRTTWLPYLQRVPTARHYEFLEEVLAAYLSGKNDAGGPVTTEMQRLEYLAVRPE